MRDEYGRITPDFEAWEKLGYKLEETHESTYTLCNDLDSYFDYVNICCDYDNEPEYFKEHFNFPSSHLEEFTEEEKAQIEKDIKNWKEEMAKVINHDSQRTN